MGVLNPGPEYFFNAQTFADLGRYSADSPIIVNSVSFYLGGIASGHYKVGSEEYDAPGGGVSLTISLPKGASSSASAAQGGGHSTGEPDFSPTGGTGESKTIDFTGFPASQRIMLSGDVSSVSVSNSGYAGGFTYNVSPAYANFSWTWPDGSSGSVSDVVYGTSGSTSHTVSYTTYYHGNGGIPDLQSCTQSYSSNVSWIADEVACSIYPASVTLSPSSEHKYFYRFPTGVAMPTYTTQQIPGCINEHIFEGWYNQGTNREVREEWLDGRDLGTAGGQFDVWAHYVSPPVWQFRDGSWHKFIPSGMTRENVNYVRDAASGQLTKPIRTWNGSAWKLVRGHAQPPYNDGL